MTSRTDMIGQNGNTGEHYDTPWFEGDRAAEEGLGRDSNPYHSDPDNGRLWDMGYRGVTEGDTSDD